MFPVLAAQAGAPDDTLFNKTVTKWFSAWELVYNNIYGMNTIDPVDLVLFDDQYVYSTSDVSIPEGDPVTGAGLSGLVLKWKKKAHGGMLIFPDGSSAPVGITCFASENVHTGIPYFVMPLTAFWENKGVGSNVLGLENLVTGVFLHEFSHTQQMNNFGKKITAFTKMNAIEEDGFDDNFIQNTFQQDADFVKLYDKEVAYFSEAVPGKDSIDTRKVRKGLDLLKGRRDRFFKHQYTDLSEVEDIFLTMEGLGQYTMYAWLIHDQGGNIDRATAIEGVRRSKKIWSQEHGFLLFLVLEKYLAPDKWAKGMFGSDLLYVTHLLNQQYCPPE